MDNHARSGAQSDAENIIALFERYVDGRLDGAALDQLNDLLRGSDAIRSSFVDFLNQHAYLSELLTSQQQDDASSAVAMSPANDDEVSFHESLACEAPALGDTSALGVHEALGLPGGQPTMFSWLSQWPVYLGLLAACLIATLAFQLGRQSGEQRKLPELAKSAADAMSTAKPAGIQSVHLDSGTGTLLLPGIGEVIVEGPTDFALTTARRAWISSGRMKMRVTEESGRGFVVTTPYGEITDLGTEFGLDLTEKGKAEVVVFAGTVDLAVASVAVDTQAAKERLVGGEAVSICDGALDRIVAITAAGGAGFLPNTRPAERKSSQVIVDVSDNLASAQTKKFYEIVPGGLKEDVPSHADRAESEWNGLTPQGMPSYLIGADYVKTFGNDKFNQDYRMYVTLARPARLFVFFDDRLQPPQWLSSQFRKTGDKIGSDGGSYSFINPSGARADIKFGDGKLGIGPGVSVDDSSDVWECTVDRPTTVTLGSTGTARYSMYGVAAVALDATPGEAPMRIAGPLGVESGPAGQRGNRLLMQATGWNCQAGG